MNTARVLKSLTVTTLWWLVLYAWLAHGVQGAYNLLVASAVISVLVFLCLLFVTAKPADVAPPELSAFSAASGVLYTLVLIWFGHGWLAAASALGVFSGRFYQHLCRKAAGQGV